MDEPDPAFPPGFATCQCSDAEKHIVRGYCLNGADGPDGLCEICRADTLATASTSN